MQITVELPDDLAQQMIPAGRDPARAALEDMAVEAYRAHRLTEHQLATLLGMDRYTLDGFLKEREVWLEYTMDDLRREVDLGERLWKKRQEELAASGQSREE
jgi:predicted HTH domain antitoxin